jgi:hypothetical protein
MQHVMENLLRIKPIFQERCCNKNDAVYNSAFRIPHSAFCQLATGNWEPATGISFFSLAPCPLHPEFQTGNLLFPFSSRNSHCQAGNREPATCFFILFIPQSAIVEPVTNNDFSLGPWFLQAPGSPLSAPCSLLR